MKKSNQTAKRKFRASKEWKDFRKYMMNKQKVDPVTGNKLTKMFNLHHLDLDENHYEDISNENNFVCLGYKTHELVHFLFSKTKPKQWRERIKRLIPILERMEAIALKELSE